MPLDSAGMLLVRLCLFGPLLYLGLVLVVDPSIVVTLGENFNLGLRNFEHQIQARPWRRPWRMLGRPPDSTAFRGGVRLAGFALCTFAFLHIAGIVK
jgi:hypothetical protein